MSCMAAARRCSRRTRMRAWTLNCCGVLGCGLLRLGLLRLRLGRGLRLIRARIRGVGILGWERGVGLGQLRGWRIAARALGQNGVRGWNRTAPAEGQDDERTHRYRVSSTETTVSSSTTKLILPAVRPANKAGHMLSCELTRPTDETGSSTKAHHRRMQCSPIRY